MNYDYWDSFDCEEQCEEYYVDEETSSLRLMDRPEDF